MKIYSVNSKAFSKYGKVIQFPFKEELETNMQKVERVEKDTSYSPSIEAIESENVKKFFYEYYGELDVEVGVCQGYNNILNALEWHKSSEINYAYQDLILLLGDIREMKDGFFDTKNLKAFLLKKGETIEVYSTTLHFCPISCDNKYFSCVVVLPKGTNTNLEYDVEDKRLIRKNKWLIVHPDCKKFVDAGRVVGIKGKNITL